MCGGASVVPSALLTSLCSCLPVFPVAIVSDGNLSSVAQDAAVIAQVCCGTSTPFVALSPLLTAAVSLGFRSPCTCSECAALCVAHNRPLRSSSVSTLAQSCLPWSTSWASTANGPRCVWPSACLCLKWHILKMSAHPHSAPSYR